MSLLIGAMGVGGLLSFGIATSHLPTVGASSETLRGSPDTARTSWHGANAVPVRYGPAGSGALVTVAPAHGYVATPANVSGGGFAASTAISLTFGTTAISTCSAGGLTTNSTGNFTCVFAVPILASGSYSIGATDGVSVASAPFTIDPPTLGLAPGSGVIGSLIDASGSGYAPSTPLTVTFGPTPITTCGSGSLMANATGNLSCSFVVPTARAGPVDVNATDGTNAATAVFALSAPTIAVAPTSGVIGSDAHLTGGGFSLLTRLTVDFGATALASCTSGSLRTNATGALDCTFPVPSTPAGTATINASDGTNFATVGFVVLAPTLALVPNTGWVGSSATASGNGFVPSNALTLDFGTNSITSCSAGGLTANATGALNCTFQVPTVAAGTYSVNASDGTNYATASFVVGPPTLSLAPTSGYVGTPVVASGAGYRASTVVTITFAGIAVSTCTSGSLRTSAQGDLSCTFSVPHATTGTRTVLVSDGTNTASASYTVLPDLTLSPANGTIGTAVLAVGTGFDATSSFTVSWNATFSLYAGTTDASGGFSFSFDVPNAPGGGHVVTAQEGANTATAGFSVLPSLTLNPTAGTVGRDVNVHASGLDAATAYTASWDGTVTLCAGTTDANGNALCSFDVPAAPEGIHTVKVVEGANAPSATFSVSPNLVLLPAGGAVAAPVTLLGTGFEASGTYTACFLVNVSACSSGTSISTVANGSTASGTTLIVPTLPPGPYYVDIAQSGSFVASAPFSVTSATLALDPTTGPVGTVVGISGAAFTADTQYTFCFQPTVAACSGTNVFTTNGTGDVPSGVGLTVPSAPGGGYYVDVSRAGLVVALAGFTVTALAAIAPASGTVGSSTVVTATGLDGGAIYAIDWNLSATVCTGTTDGTGSLACTFDVPGAPAGSHTLTVVEGDNAPTVTFSILPSVTVNASAGPVGASVTAAGAGFDALSAVHLSWNGGATLCTASTDANGAFACGFTVPAAPEGPGTIVATEGGLRTTLVYVVTPSAALSASTGEVGSSVGAVGTGLPASEPFSVAWDVNLTVCSGSTSPIGGFSCTFAVPPAAAGLHSLNVTVGANTVPLTYNVTSAFALASTIGFVGSVVNATGTGLDPLAAYTLTWNATSTPCSGQTDVNGGFVCPLTIPLTPGGAHTLNLTEGSRALSATFTIAPRAILSPSTGSAGNSIDLLATGLAASVAVTVTWNGSLTLCRGVASASGAYLCGFIVPAGAHGTYDVSVAAGSAPPVTAMFTVGGAPPTPASSGTTPFPWWVVAVVAVAAAVLLVALVALRRRRPAPGPDVSPSADIAPADAEASGRLPGPTASPAVPDYLEPPPPAPDVRPVPAPIPMTFAPPPPPPAPTPAPATPAESPDIDLLIDQLDKIAAEILKKPPPAEASGTSDTDAEDGA